MMSMTKWACVFGFLLLNGCCLLTSRGSGSNEIDIDLTHTGEYTFTVTHKCRGAYRARLDLNNRSSFKDISPGDCDFRIKVEVYSEDKPIFSKCVDMASPGIAPSYNQVELFRY